jgi:ribosomal protein L11 methyltransferase
LTTLFKVRVEDKHAERASELLFHAGFAGLSEESTGASVTLTAGAEDKAETERMRNAFERAAAEHGFPFEGWTEELSDDWKLSWIEALEPVQLTPTVRLVPREPPATRLPGDLYLKPALAFGYGEHPTTRMAASWLQERALGRRVLDVGSGTGVLCFVAAHKGAHHAHGVDIDGPSVLAAQDNARLNGLDQLCTFSTAQLEALSCDFEVVIANIDARTLRSLASELCARLAPGGSLGLTGLLEEQTQEVQSAFESCGCRFAPPISEAGWCLLSAQR